MKICIIGASGKLGTYMVQHALDRGYEVVGVCRERSVSKLDGVQRAHHSHSRRDKRPAGDSDRLSQAATGSSPCWSRGAISTTQREQPRRCSTLRRPGARLIFSCGWHITAMARMCTRPSLQREEKIARWLTDGSLPSLTLTTRWKRAGGCLPAARAGQSCGEATSKRARARAYRFGVSM